MKEIGVKKEPGYSWIEVGNEVHRFMVGDSWHPQSPKVHAHLDVLWEQMKEAGYVPDKSCVLPQCTREWHTLNTLPSDHKVPLVSHLVVIALTQTVEHSEQKKADQILQGRG
ncbi:hypothetical protein HPP92_000838 [Vanilla planifolia]|uniref:Uncharacterized protein n=1 Tax=Vanilla planifolia TaxID=51239 RepID=A0A835VET5_VANPL|nr:hypothetical protein HPP92_000838 [Vanilla planifolia]